MSRLRNQRSVGIALAFVLLLLIAVPVLASTLALFELPWWTVDAGGGVSNGGVYSLNGTAGQPDAGVSSGGLYELRGGFWSADPYRLTYLPMLRNGPAD